MKLLVRTAMLFLYCSGAVKAEAEGEGQAAGVDALGRSLKERNAGHPLQSSKRQLLDKLLDGYDLDKWPTFPDESLDNGQLNRRPLHQEKSIDFDRVVFYSDGGSHH